MQKNSISKLEALNSTGNYFGEIEQVKINNVELEYHPQSPESSLRLLMVMGDLLKNSPELHSIVTRFFPELEEVYSKLDYFVLMELIGTITQKMLLGAAQPASISAEE